MYVKELSVRMELTSFSVGSLRQVQYLKSSHTHSDVRVSSGDAVIPAEMTMPLARRVLKGKKAWTVRPK